jgi:hypothetical protein
MGKSSAPPPPDPKQTAQQQAQINRETAITQYGLSAANQITPQGSLTYDQIGTWADGTPRYQSTVSLSPEQQKLYELNTQTEQNLGQIGVDQTRKVAGILSTPFDVNTAANTQQADMARSLLDPIWQQRQKATEAQLINRGIQPGTDAYNNMIRDFNDERDRAYTSAALAGRGQAVTEALANRNQPLNEISALTGGSQVSMPSFGSTPQPTVAPVDYTGLVNNQYQGQVAAYNADQQRKGALYGAIGSIAGAGLGGWAMGGFKGASSLFGGR